MNVPNSFVVTPYLVLNIYNENIHFKLYGYGDYVNYIRIPKGTKILYIEGATLTQNEFEVLLPPDIELHLVDEVSDKLLKWTL
ncbi:hypothetical protein TL18_04925 [Methanobrevibacter sp. YE315]|uniref:hypothetical protein n=1 Tax=Methanobrevibacter sp. YE315 TaxID=1609968 RepID=UPI000764E48E|nr:hypothetical protein [Methanobrevibacter sp. YE315]AMD17418.1 hypothetical protein TL18_04925 [Methanobrevibacter sp. YE315]